MKSMSRTRYKKLRHSTWSFAWNSSHYLYLWMISRTTHLGWWIKMLCDNYSETDSSNGWFRLRPPGVSNGVRPRDSSTWIGSLVHGVESSADNQPAHFACAGANFVQLRVAQESPHGVVVDVAVPTCWGEWLHHLEGSAVASEPSYCIVLNAH